MMDQEAIVARIEGDQAYVEVGGAGTGCGRCHETGGCQSGIYTRLFRSTPRQYRVANPIDAAPGDRVIVRVAGGATLRAALLAYGMPVFFLILGALAGSAYSAGNDRDLTTALGAVIGMVTGILAGILARRSQAMTLQAPTLILARSESSFCISKEANQ